MTDIVTYVLCSVCDKDPAEAGALDCGHEFCSDCFARYEQGSLEELDHCIRCCICGNRTLLTRETNGENVLLSFGRDSFPKLLDPVGITSLSTGNYVTADPANKRVYVFDEYGNHQNDFPYVHKTSPLSGIAVTKESHIAIPFSNGIHCIISYFTQDGGYLSSTHLEPGCCIRSLAVSDENEIFVTDSTNGCVYIINTKRAVSKTIKLEKMEEDDTEPTPWGIAVNSRGEILITDSSNDTIRVYSKDHVLTSTIGSTGMRPGQFRHPCGLAVDEYDRIVVADRGNHRVQLFSEDFRFRRYVVRYNSGRGVYMAPRDVTCVRGNRAAVLLTGTKDAHAGEVRLYTTTGAQM